jgi:cytochrome c553
MKKTVHIRTMVILILLGLVTTLVQAAPLTQPVQEKERAVLFPSTRMINQGRDVAESACASCHGLNGISDSEGTPQLAGQRAV